MIVDASALVSILFEEDGWDSLFNLIANTKDVSLSTGNYVETCLVIDGRKQARLSDRVESLLADLRIQVVPLTPSQARIARQAFRTYGKGIHSKAGLNFGDCFAYALAKETGEPLLFVGNDFVHTDIIPAIDPPILTTP